MTIRILGLLFTASALVWLVGEAGLQIVQYFRGGRVKTTEWRSFAVLTVAGVIAAIAANLLARHVRLPIFPTRTVALALALPVFWGGIAFRLWAIRTLGRFFRGVVHIQEDHQVVEAGPYRILRHPSYTGLLLAIIGVCLAADNVAVFLVVFLVVVAALLYRIHVEERTLLRELGQPYADYAAQRSRLIPGIW
ncbi:methyltransferase family protein [Fodinicola acaciae]|uniref:methyltransferase family protein n=1 Tax=Fodinicola acaciae TaxID=2681555 RepID=UPI0013D43FEB|nr:isoprenylcysteine carboxylmethyltransferase family protein [Fodinicola acaciae]